MWQRRGAPEVNLLGYSQKKVRGVARKRESKHLWRHAGKEASFFRHGVEELARHTHRNEAFDDDCCARPRIDVDG